MFKLTRIVFLVFCVLFAGRQVFGGENNSNFIDSQNLNFSHKYNSGVIWESPFVGEHQLLVVRYGKDPATSFHQQIISEAQKMISSVYVDSYGISHDQAISELDALRGDNAQLLVLKNLIDNKIVGTLVLIEGQLNNRYIKLPAEKSLDINLYRGEEGIYEFSKFVIRPDLNFETFKVFQQILALYLNWFTNEGTIAKKIIFYAKKKSLMKLYKRYFFANIISEKIVKGPDNINSINWLMEPDVTKYLTYYLIKTPIQNEKRPCVKELLSAG